jgi:Zn finger protein HypA/HybF involved in hydrogenase expression
MTDEKTLVRKIYEVMGTQLGPNPQGRLRKIVIRCDSLATIEVGKLNTFWHELAREPIYADSYIELHQDPPFGRCVMCNQEFELSEETVRCPSCHHEQFKVIHGLPTIETYEME